MRRWNHLALGLLLAVPVFGQTTPAVAPRRGELISSPEEDGP
jgi:hypothetical protein